MCQEAAIDRRLTNAAFLMFIWLSSSVLIERTGESEAAQGEFQTPVDLHPLCPTHDVALYLVYVIRWTNLNDR